MCFVLYIASDSPIPDIPWDDTAPKLHTTALTEHDSAVRGAFTKRNVKYLGSSNHCGCGFRHPSNQIGEWPEEYLIGNDPEFGSDTQEDHDSLYKFLIQQSKSTNEIEIYGCWDGEFSEPPARHEKIQVDDVVSDEFFLRERCHYTINLKPNHTDDRGITNGSL